MPDISKFTEYGLIGLIIGVLFFILWRIIIYTMAFVKTTTEQHAKERETWQVAVNKHNEILTKISDSIDDHDRRADERGKFVRDEHKEMIDVLKKMNGSKG